MPGLRQERRQVWIAALQLKLLYHRCAFLYAAFISAYKMPDVRAVLSLVH